MECPTPGLMPGGLEGLKKELLINSAAATRRGLYSCEPWGVGLAPPLRAGQLYTCSQLSYVDT